MNDGQIELLQPYIHRTDPEISALPFEVHDDRLELTISNHGMVITGWMLASAFLLHFQRDDNHK